ncbi:hypothetical protein MKW92_041428 [Papaver armeniacum]|nr:hypothetical protein MKW92_041428 [Papaver armeniacum]
MYLVLHLFLQPGSVQIYWMSSRGNRVDKSDKAKLEDTVRSGQSECLTWGMNGIDESNHPPLELRSAIYVRVKVGLKKGQFIMEEEDNEHLKKKVYGWGCLQINVRVLLPI